MTEEPNTPPAADTAPAPAAPPAAAAQPLEPTAAASAPPAADATPAPPTPPATAAPPAAEAAAPAPDAEADAAEMSPAECGQALHRLFPALFAGRPAKPLKLRIQTDIQARAPGRFSRRLLSAFLHRHTGSTGYLIALTKAPHRYDLDGQPAGEISDEHREAAIAELARRRGSHESRLAQEEQQRRNRAALLHDWQTTTLTRANFCALKGVAADELDGLLERAREEAEAWAQRRPPAPARDHRPPSGKPRPADRRRTQAR